MQRSDNLRCKAIAQQIISVIGSAGPENAEDAVVRLIFEWRTAQNRLDRTRKEVEPLKKCVKALLKAIDNIDWKKM